MNRVLYNYLPEEAQPLAQIIRQGLDARGIRVADCNDLPDTWDGTEAREADALVWLISKNAFDQPSMNSLRAYAEQIRLPIIPVYLPDFLSNPADHLLKLYIPSVYLYSSSADEVEEAINALAEHILFSEPTQISTALEPSTDSVSKGEPPHSTTAVSPAYPLSPSQLAGQAIGNYSILEQIGAGGMGYLFVALDQRLRRRIALKIIDTRLADNPEFVEHFDREARALAALEHPHIVPIHDYGTFQFADGAQHQYVAMRWLSGGSLEARIRQLRAGEQSYPLKEAVTLIREIAGALDYAHSQGIVHHDVKPQNILFDQFGSAFLIDFGIAEIMGEFAFREGAVVGTPHFMAPEAWNAARATPEIDQYSLAVTAFYAIAGEVPFASADWSISDLMDKHLHALPPPIQQFRPEAPEAMNAVFQRALAKDPGDRYPSCRAFAEALEDALRYVGKKLRVFVSYSSRNRDEIAPLVARLEEFGHAVWYDTELKNTGGQHWWDNILREIREADLFVFAMTRDSLMSFPCELESTYAHMLDKRILPVMLQRIDPSVLPTHLVSLQFVDFTLPDGYLTLKNSIDRLPAARPLPQPLPEPPSVPVSALNKLAEQIALPALSDDEQLLVVAKLEDLLDTPRTHDGALSLLVKLRERVGLAASARRKIEKLVGSD